MSTKKVLYWVTFYSVAMGFLETAVVVYLRKLYYPQGFDFPLAPIPADVASVEIWREAATIVMLLAVGILAGKSRAGKFAWFIYSFAIWDIFYYVFLWVFLGWPQSLMTWDILFLLPVPWVGPVITPVIVAITMILFALTVVRYEERGVAVALKRSEVVLLATGSLIAIIAFTEDYMAQKGDILYRNLGRGKDLFADLAQYVPQHFDWLVFTIGEALLVAAWILYYKRLRGIAGVEGTVNAAAA